LLWPGTFSLSAARFPMGGTAMFGVLAILGDAGGALGPWLAGETADAAMRSTGPLARVTAHLADDGGSGLRIGLLVSTRFPVAIGVLTIAYALTRRSPDASIQQIHPEHAPD